MGHFLMSLTSSVSSPSVMSEACSEVMILAPEIDFFLLIDLDYSNKIIQIIKHVSTDFLKI